MPSAANHPEAEEGGWGIDTAQSGLGKAVSFVNSQSACDYEEAMREHSMKKSNSIGGDFAVAVALAAPEKVPSAPEPWYKRAWKALASVRLSAGGELIRAAPQMMGRGARGRA
jgi:hypothetical protein